MQACAAIDKNAPERKAPGDGAHCSWQIVVAAVAAAVVVNPIEIMIERAAHGPNESSTQQ